MYSQRLYGGLAVQHMYVVYLGYKCWYILWLYFKYCKVFFTHLSHLIALNVRVN